jgi:hypothetical protein
MGHNAAARTDARRQDTAMDDWRDTDGIVRDVHYRPEEEAWFRNPRDEAGREFDPDSGALRVVD